MTLIKNDNFLRALRRQPVDRQPIWLMRQAGRYLPEYRAIREKAGSFLNLCKQPALACQVTLQPLARFDLDAAILFSDILMIPEAMGMGLSFAENEGPRFSHQLHNEADIKKLPVPDPHLALPYVMQTIALIKRELDQRLPLIGFAGSPWTVACYMLEHGAKTKSFEPIRKLAYESPKTLHLLLEKLTEASILYLKAQIESGVDAVMIFDTWGGVLSPSQYQTFSLSYMKRIVEACSPTPRIIFTKNAGQALRLMAASGADAVGVDWTMDLREARKLTKDQVTLQGNLDPLALFASEAAIAQEVKNILQAMQGAPGFIFNLGHGILPTTSPDKVKFLVDTVHQ